jgi:hypothetical protein
MPTSVFGRNSLPTSAWSLQFRNLLYCRTILPAIIFMTGGRRGASKL